MAGIRYRQSVALCGLTLFSFVASAQADVYNKWGSSVDLEAKLGNKRTLGEADLLLPLTQDARSLVFADLRARFDNSSGSEGNVGLGWRRMEDSGWNLGVYGFYDRRRSDLGNYFNQATLGAEALGRDWDFRANAYLPFGTKAKVLGAASEATLSGASIQVTTTTREERSLKGFDAEVGWRAPLFEYEAHRQLRFYLGGYRFSDAGLAVQGPRVRAELVMEDLHLFTKGSSLRIGAEAQHDSARGDQSFFSLRLRIPLDKEGGRTSTLNAQERRMTAPVVRDVDIVTQSHVASTLVETVDASRASSAVTVNGQAITLVNSTTTSGANLQTALNAAGANSTVVLAGTFNTGSATTTLQAGQTLMGTANVTVTTPSGHTANLTTPGATISGSGLGVGASMVVMSNNSSLIGLTLTSTTGADGGYVVNAQGLTGVTIRNNTLSASFNSGYAVDLVSSTNAVVTGNTISATSSGAGVSAIGIRVAAANNAKVADNTITATGAVSYVVAGSNTTSFAAGSTGNVAVHGVCFFSPSAPATSSVGFNNISCP